MLYEVTFLSLESRFFLQTTFIFQLVEGSTVYAIRNCYRSFAAFLVDFECT